MTSGCTFGKTGIWWSDDLYLHAAISKSDSNNAHKSKIEGPYHNNGRPAGGLRSCEALWRGLFRSNIVAVRLGWIAYACLQDRVQIQSAAFGSGRETSEFVDCTFNGARMNMAPGGFARFVRRSFRDVNIQDWACFTVEMIDCTFTGRLDTAIFNGTVPEDKRGIIGRASNEFHGNDFSAMNLIDVAFRTGIDLTKQVLPS